MTLEEFRDLKAGDQIRHKPTKAISEVVSTAQVYLSSDYDSPLDNLHTSRFAGGRL